MATLDNRTLPDPPDEIETSHQRPLDFDLPNDRLVRNGALALTSQASPGPYLGPPHGLSCFGSESPRLEVGNPEPITGLDNPAPWRAQRDELVAALRASIAGGGSAAPAQRYIPEGRIENSPVVTAAARMRVARNLLSHVNERRAGVDLDADAAGEDRQAKCQWVRRVAEDKTAILRRESWRDTAEPRSTRAYSVPTLVRCNSWCCATCGPSRARAAASLLAIAFERHLGGKVLRDKASIAALLGADVAGELEAMPADDDTRWRDVWMLTLAPPNYIEVATELEVDQLYRATAHLFASTTWRRFAERWGVVGRVRALDATHGGVNGTHTHFHVALFVDRAAMSSRSAWYMADLADARAELEELAGELHGHRKGADNAAARAAAIDRAGDARAAIAALQRDRPDAYAPFLDEKNASPLRAESQAIRTLFLEHVARELAPAWEKAMRAVGARIDNLTAFRSLSLNLQPAEHAVNYFTKWGLADEVGAPTSKSNNHLRLLDAVADGCDAAGDVYRQFRRAMKGRTFVSGLEDLANTFHITDDDVSEYVAELVRKRRLELEELGHEIVDLPAFTVDVENFLFPAVLVATYETFSEWDAVYAFLDDVSARGGDLQTELDHWLWSQLPKFKHGPPS